MHGAELDRPDHRAARTKPWGSRLRTLPAPGAPGSELGAEEPRGAARGRAAAGTGCHLGAEALGGGVGDHGAGTGEVGRLTCSSRGHRCGSLRGQHGASAFSRRSRGARRQERSEEALGEGSRRGLGSG